MKKLFVLVFISLLSFAKAQTPFYKQFTVNDGLPSSELFDVTQDNLGRIWFASNYGVGYYDGYSFKTFSMNEGLAENSIIRIFHGKNGKLWFLSYSGKLSFYKNGKIFPFEGNNKMLRFGNGKDLLSTIKIDTVDNIWFQSNELGKICKIPPNLNLQTIDTNLMFYKNYSTFLFFDDRYNKKYYNHYDSLLNLVNSREYSYKMQEEGFINFKIDFLVETDDKKSYFKINGNYYTLSADYSLKIIKNKRNLKYKYYLSGLQNIYEEKNGNIWIRIRNNGVYLYSKENLSRKPEHFFNHRRVTRILRDKDGNYWIATDGNGLFLVPSFQFSVYNKSNGIANENVLSFDIKNQHLYFATNDNNIYKARIVNGIVRNISKFFPVVNHLTFGRNILCHSDGSVWIVTSPFLKYDTAGRKIPLNVIIRNKLYQAIELMDHSVVIATKLGFIKYFDNQIVYDSREDGFDKHIRTIFEDREGVLWLGTMNGLYSFKNKKFKFYGEKDTLLKSRISAINDCDNNLIVGTHDKGLVILNDTIYHINSSNGLNSNMIKTLLVENDSIIWAGTNNGLKKIVCSKTLNKMRFQITNFTVWDGLPSNEINEIKIYGKELWIATNCGMATINIQKLKKSTSSPVVYMEYVLVNEQDTLTEKNNILKYNQNNINFFYKGIGYNGPADIIYKIKLKGVDKKWIITKNTSARYTGLSAGDYTFFVKAANSSGVWIEKPTMFSFTIQKHFTKKLWFLILIVLTAIIMLFGIFLLILRTQKVKAENRQQLLRSEQKALLSQMNPHFIFNSLSSIQYLILEKNLKESAIYLANFSSLMRRVLENSKCNTIPLSEELKTLRLYLDLEKKRFDDKFDYQFIIDSSIPQDDVTIPPMLLQPYLENAIWHGLMLKKTKGFLVLKIEKYHKNGIICHIEDNGIGREEAGRISSKRKNHRSTGMKNIEERIALLNKIYKTKIEIKIVDIYDKNNDAAGTRVSLSIPAVVDF